MTRRWRQNHQAADDRADLQLGSETYTGGRNFGHLAYAVEDIYALCEKLMRAGVTINRPPRDGYMAFIRSPDSISIELLQQGEALPRKALGIHAEHRGLVNLS